MTRPTRKDLPYPRLPELNEGKVKLTFLSRMVQLLKFERGVLWIKKELSFIPYYLSHH